MSADIKKIHGEVVFINPVITEAVATELGAGEKAPGGRDSSIAKGRGHKGDHMIPCCARNVREP